MLVLAICIAVIALIQVICVLALIDQYRGLLKIRANLGLIDATQPLELAAIGAGTAPSAIGLPAGLDLEERTAVLFLSTTCSTCRTIGQALQGRVREPLWLVIEGPSTEACTKWLSDVRLSGDRIAQDIHGDIAARLGLEIAPSALIFQSGQLVRAAAVSSVRQLQRFVAQGSPDGHPRSFQDHSAPQVAAQRPDS